MNRKEPLGLPRGSVRAILTLMLVIIAAVCVFVPAANESAATAVLALAGIAVRDYFATRKEQNDSQGPPLDPPATFED